MSASEFNDAWPAKLFAGGWICATWPIEYGGKGLSTLQGVVLAEEFARVKAPLRADFFGDTLVGPTILQWGSEAQKKEFLPKILRGEVRWCQGFSEPDSGSDLASLKTSAVLDGDEWVINGQKVWTTQGDDADYCFLLTRTDPRGSEAPGDLVPARADAPSTVSRSAGSPSLTAPPSSARCSSATLDALPTTSSAASTKGGRSPTRRWRSSAANRRRPATAGSPTSSPCSVDAARERRLDADPLIRQRLAGYYTKIQILRINGLAHARRPARSEEDESIAALGATNKMFWSEMHQQAMELALDLYGAEAMLIDTGPPADSWPGTLRAGGRPGYPGVADDDRLLLLPFRDDLGWHQPDPAQHRRRADPRAAQGAQARTPV